MDMTTDRKTALLRRVVAIRRDSAVTMGCAAQLSTPDIALATRGAARVTPCCAVA
jgi:hypothetical protein